MRIDSIRLVDFRKFEDTTFSFNAHFNVLIGENGRGKTTILEALAAAINSFVAVVEGRNVRGIKKEDVRRVSYDQSIEAKLNTALYVEGTIDNQPVSWSVSKPQFNWGFLKADDRAVKAYAKRLVNQLADDGGKDIILPAFVYLGSGRLWTESSEKVNTLPKGSRLLGYRHCLSSKGSFKQFAEWFKTLELSALQEASQGRFSNISTGIQVVRAAVASCMEGWSSIYYSVADDMLMARNSTGQLLPFNYLSDGQRNVIGLVADIAYRCVLLNPALGLEATHRTPGIVLIDELDLHLHPNWQKQIVGRLKEAFPAIQFITTSHSPFIVQSLHRDELLSLNPDSVSSADPFRRSLEEVAEADMAVRDVTRSVRFKDMERTAARYFDLIAADRPQLEINEVKAELDALETAYNDDPAFVALLRAERKANAI